MGGRYQGIPGDLEILNVDCIHIYHQIMTNNPNVCTTRFATILFFSFLPIKLRGVEMYVF